MTGSVMSFFVCLYVAVVTMLFLHIIRIAISSSVNYDDYYYYQRKQHYITSHHLTLFMLDIFRCFSRCNKYLIDHDKEAIDWNI